MKLYVLLSFNLSQNVRNQSTPVIKFFFKSAATQPFETLVSRLLAGECNVSFDALIWKLEAWGVQKCHPFYYRNWVHQMFLHTDFSEHWQAQRKAGRLKRLSCSPVYRQVVKNNLKMTIFAQLQGTI
jgi:hypothetical protein